MNKRNKCLIIIIVLLFISTLLIACGEGNSEESKVVNIETEESEVASIETEEIHNSMEIKYSEGFNVEFIEGEVKKLTDGEGREFLLVPRGEEAPEGYDDMEIIYTPVENVLTSSATQVSLMQPLGVIDSISAVMSDKDAWFIEEVVEGFENESITFVGSGNAPDYELIKSINPEIAIVYGGTWGQFEMMDKFDELGIPYVVNNEYMEEDPLARMEWIKFLAALYNEEVKAEAFFDESIKSLENLEEKLPSEDKTTVFWGSIRDGKISATNPKSYVGRKMEMAGADYIFKDLPVQLGESVTLTPEEFYAESIDADVWIYASTQQFAGSLEDIINQAPIIEDLKSIQEENIWVFDDSYWQMLHKTPEMIEDLAAIYYPEIFPNHEVRHFIKAE